MAALTKDFFPVMLKYLHNSIAPKENPMATIFAFGLCSLIDSTAASKSFHLVGEKNLALLSWGEMIDKMDRYIVISIGFKYYVISEKDRHISYVISYYYV